MFRAMTLVGLAMAQPEAGFDLEATLGRGDRTLTPVETVQRAWSVAPELEVARAEVEAAGAAVRSAQVPLAPRLLLSGNVERVGGFPDGAILTPAGEVSIEIPKNRAGLQAELTYPLSRVFFGVLPRLGSARARERAERYEAVATREELALQALESYWTHALARGGLAVGQAALQQAEAQRDRLVAMQRAGFATPADVAAAEARLAESTERVVRARGADQVARTALALLIDQPEDLAVAFPSAALDLPPPSARSAAELEAEAARARPELRALDAAIEATRDEQRAAWSDRLPQLDVRGGATYAQPNPNVVPPAERFDPSWSVGARLSWSPNDWWSAENRDDRVDADRIRLTHERARLWRSVRVSIRTELASLESARGAWAAARARVRAAEESYQSRRAAFDNGRGIFTDVLDADAELSAARQAKLDALVDTHLARARLDRAVGRLSTSVTD